MASKTATVQMVPENVKLGTSSLVCVKHVSLTGDVSIGDGCIINPRVRLAATHGPIVIGNRVLIEDRVVVENESSAPLVIGDGVVIEADAIIKASLGAGTLVEMKGVVHSALADGMVVGPGCVYRRPSVAQGTREYLSAKQSHAQTMPRSPTVSREQYPVMSQSTTAMLDLTRKHVRAYQEVYAPRLA